jgi:transcriptional regulator with XRE-family HTH domain
MPERSFGRTVRYRRTKLGLSQAKLGELVGRSTSTIRSWERDTTQPNDPKILAVLAAILAVDERQLFEKAGVDLPVVEASPTVEQALATLHPPERGIQPDQRIDRAVDHPEPSPEIDEVFDLPDPSPYLDEGLDQGPKPAEPPPIVSSPQVAQAFVTPPEPFQITPPTPSLADLSYVEDQSQRQLYRVRTLATLVAAVVLVIAFLWAFSESLGALGDWWDEFFGNLRL